MFRDGAWVGAVTVLAREQRTDGEATVFVVLNQVTFPTVAFRALR